MLDRLVGLETEYAVRFQPRVAGGERLSNSDVFAHLLKNVRAKVATASAISGGGLTFLANGGCVKFEQLPIYKEYARSGLVEGATPECRGPRQLLRYQRAQDILLSEGAAAGSAGWGQATLIKNSHDGDGHYFGCHENYEVEVATGFRLQLWRYSLYVLVPVIFLLALAGQIARGIMLAYAPLLLVPVYCLFPGTERRERAKVAMLRWTVRLSALPLQVVGTAIVRLTAFRDVRRQLLPFLVSRSIITGVGVISKRGRFTLSPRALGLRSVCGITAAVWRSIFYFCHILTAVTRLSAGDPTTLADLFQQRQRLQISIADSNMAQVAEYLKIGTTLLVLDAIEAGELKDVPRLWWPLRALRVICADPNLQAKVWMGTGQRRTALQIQRFYLEACQRFVDRSEPVGPEVLEILRLWEETLECLEHDRSQLVGKLDWVTKQYLLDGLGKNAPIVAQRKLDLGYHELARYGYYVMLEAAGVAPTLADPELVREATRVAPESTPARLRGQLIQLFAGISPGLRASWSTVITPSGEKILLAEVTERKQA